MQHNEETIIGFDFGLKKIGVAVGNSAINHAQPITTLSAKHGVPNWNEIKNLIDIWQPSSLVVGNPDSQTNEHLMAKLKLFVKKLQAQYAYPVHLVNESYSSIEAQHRVMQNRKNSKDIEIDKIAAALIIETWFNQNACKK